MNLVIKNGHVVDPANGVDRILDIFIQDNKIASLDDVIRQHIETALQQVDGRVEGTRGAAELLQVNANTLRARMRKLGIDWKSFRR